MKKPAKKQKGVFMATRVPSRTYDRIKELARIHSRSVAAEMFVALTSYIAIHDARSMRPTPEVPNDAA